MPPGTPSSRISNHCPASLGLGPPTPDARGPVPLTLMPPGVGGRALGAFPGGRRWVGGCASVFSPRERSGATAPSCFTTLSGTANQTSGGGHEQEVTWERACTGKGGGDPSFPTEACPSLLPPPPHLTPRGNGENKRGGGRVQVGKAVQLRLPLASAY